MARLCATLALTALFCALPARAGIVLSDLIVDLQVGKPLREDIEIFNYSPERAFVAVEPREIIDPGSPEQSNRLDPDPEKLGLLASPSRLILEPGQRRLLRIAALVQSSDREHVYRITVKPVAGNIQSEASGLKVMLGYDVLVLVRPTRPVVDLTGHRSGRHLTFANKGNVSVEVVDGQQCAMDKTTCVPLPGKRIYAGASWSVDLPSDLPANYTIEAPGRSDRRTF